MICLHVDHSLTPFQIAKIANVDGRRKMIEIKISIILLWLLDIRKEVASLDWRGTASASNRDPVSLYEANGTLNLGRSAMAGSCRLPACVVCP